MVLLSQLLSELLYSSAAKCMIGAAKIMEMIQSLIDNRLAIETKGGERERERGETRRVSGAEKRGRELGLGEKEREGE